MCPLFLCLGPILRYLGGLKEPWRLQKSLKTVGSQIAFQANPSGLNIGWTWLIIVSHIQGVSLGLLDQSEMSMGGPRTAWNQLYWPKWYFLAKGHPSNPNWVEKCLNMVEYCQTHPGGSLGNPRTAQKWPFGLKMAFFLTIGATKSFKWVGYWLNNHIQGGLLQGGHQACIICGNLQTWFAGTFFPRHFYLQRRKKCLVN